MFGFCAFRRAQLLPVVLRVRRVILVSEVLLADVPLVAKLLFRVISLQMAINFGDAGSTTRLRYPPPLDAPPLGHPHLPRAFPHYRHHHHHHHHHHQHHHHEHEHHAYHLQHHPQELLLEPEPDPYVKIEKQWDWEWKGKEESYMVAW